MIQQSSLVDKITSEKKWLPFASRSAEPSSLLRKGKSNSFWHLVTCIFPKDTKPSLNQESHIPLWDIGEFIFLRFETLQAAFLKINGQIYSFPCSNCTLWSPFNGLKQNGDFRCYWYCADDTAHDANMYLQKNYKYKKKQIYIYVHIHTYKHVYIYTYLHIYIYICR